MHGSTGQLLYQGAVLAASQNIVVVSVAVRLGVLGNFYWPSKAPGNQALLDLRLALDWYRNNSVRAFGARADGVTLAGHSAGAVLTSLFASQRDNRDLFSQIALFSGGHLFSRWGTMTHQTALAKSEMVSGQHKIDVQIKYEVY
ncbi:unnamed protein product [Protopolystoma xenopodis]|uniref:Carboxylesterase type B domain-containing protein n=1 Tax=Protopolystoma xenopodis TaxID=117903 RepID=A0A3S5AHQ3_9PLAT|nr:unnamed protein product [Protopolystoma xenopodis]